MFTSTEQPGACRRCLNDEENPTISVVGGLCNVCRWFDYNINAHTRSAEKSWLRSLAQDEKVECLVGLSGGKDSTATLIHAIELGLTPTAFTLQTGYYPEHILERSRAVADELGIPHLTVDARRYARESDLLSFELTAAFHDRLAAGEINRESVRALYVQSRQHYSAKCDHALAFVRSCQLCRRLVIRAYADLASTTKIPLVLLGMNEWTQLNPAGHARAGVSGIRDFSLQAARTTRVVHVPFIEGWRLADTVDLLTSISWRPPQGENVVETNRNSCGFAAAANPSVERHLGFHVDTPRLSREVTAGFLTRAEAHIALGHDLDSPQSVRKVLSDAHLVSP